MTESGAVTRVYVDLRDWDRCATWMTRRAWGVSFLERMCRLLAKSPGVEVVGLIREGQSIDDRLQGACGCMHVRAIDAAMSQAPVIAGQELYLPGNLVFTRTWIRSAMQGSLEPEGSVLVDSDASYARARRMMFEDSYKTMPEGLARPHRALAWYVGLPFFYLRVPPNVTSVLSLLVNLFGGWLVIRGQATAGALVFVLSCLLDSVDGVTARLHVRGSRFGTLLDHYLDYLYYAILIVSTGLGSYLPDQSARPLVFTGISALSTLAAVLALEWYRRVYGFESNQAFNKRVNALIVDKPSFKGWAGVLHLFKRHTFPYLYLLIALLGLEDLALLAPAILLLVPFVTRHMFHSLEKQGLLPPARWPW